MYIISDSGSGDSSRSVGNSSYSISMSTVCVVVLSVVLTIVVTSTVVVVAAVVASSTNNSTSSDSYGNSCNILY